MSDDKTIFEQIVAGEIPSYAVYEDETTYAFLDANPLAPGHTLVIPKDPYERVDDMPPELLGDVFDVAGQLAEAIETAVGADATTMAINNGEEAGQEVPHVHLHIVPQFADDPSRPIHTLFDGADLSDEEMAETAASIRDGQ